MRVTFVLPGYPLHPVGGFRVVYEYANRLAARGHAVTVVHPCDVEPARTLRQRVHRLRWPLLRRRARGDVPWFPLDPRVRRLAPWRVEPAALPDGDAVVATSWPTAPLVAALPPRTGRGYYLIQHHETWQGDAAAVDATWRLPLHKIVIARWLRDLAQAMGEGDRTTYVPNGMDTELFRITVPPEARPPR